MNEVPSRPSSPPPPRGLSRRATAWLFHAPGLWLFHRERLSPALLRANALAAIFTVAAVVAAMFFAPVEHRLWAAIAAWLVGHVAWGSYLASHLPVRE